MLRVIALAALPGAPLIVDAVYEGGALGNAGDDPISRVLKGSGNQGGFRAVGQGQHKKLIVLFTSGEDKDWPDYLDLNTGQFIYYGDNKTPGHELHDTPRGGNRMLQHVFGLLHAATPQRSLIPPFFVFRKYITANSRRSVQFKGLAAPGFSGLPATADLIAVWKTTAKQRFQNYRAIFTILDAPAISRDWLDDLTKGNALSASAPAAWSTWRQSGRYMALAAESTTVIRSQEEQCPGTELAAAILTKVWKHFERTPHAFEAFAARIFQMHDQRVIIDEITRGSVDGGRDAVGRYLLGLSDDPVYAEFSLEAKCYAPPLAGLTANAVGVKDVARLISRIRHRQFGVLVTTSTVARQAYEEVRADRHPIIFISGGDLTNILIRSGFNTPQLVEKLLCTDFAVGG